MKAVELTKNEREVLEAIVANAKHYGEDNNFVLDEIEIYRSSASLKGTTSSLQKKGMIQMNNENGYYFSGQVTEAGLHEVESSKVNSEQEVKQSNNSKNMATKKAKTVKVEDSKSVTNAVDNFDAPVMDERILKLNEYKAVKMANLSKGKRPAAKEAKELATYILNNWDNEFELLKVLNAENMNEDLRAILASRLENFEDAKKASRAEAKEESKSDHSKLTFEQLRKEINELGHILSGRIKDGRRTEDVEKRISDMLKYVSDKELESTLESLKNSINPTLTTKIAAKLTEMEINRRKHLVGQKSGAEKQPEDDEKVEKAPKAKTDKKETKKAAPAKAPKADSKKAEPKAKEEKKDEPKVAKTARKVGDVHPNHPTWIWTEYAEGKFDWRTNPADKKQGQRTDKAKTSAKKSEPKKDTKKATNKKVAKGGKVEKEEKPKELTIDEFVALPTKSAKTNKKPSEAQKEALKLIMKGYRVTADHKFFENAEGDKKACNWESVVAMLRRYGMEYVPSGLVK